MGWTEQELPKKHLPTITKTEKALLESMRNLEDEHPNAKIAVYGAQGTGKTVAAMKFAQAVTPPNKAIAYVDTKENWSSLMNHPELKRRVKRFQFENYEQVLVLAKALRRGDPPFDKFGAFVFDEHSTGIASDLAWIVRARAKQAEVDNDKFKDPFQPTQPDYLASQIRSNNLIDELMESDMHIFLLAHEKLDDDMVTRPDMKPGAANDMQRALHGVYRTMTKELKDGTLYHYLQLQPVKRISAKNRIGGLGIYATVEDVIAAYNKWGKSQQEQEQDHVETITTTEKSSTESSQLESDIDSLLN